MTHPAMLADEDDDDETCGFCIFMKAGGCKDEFKVRLASGCKYQIDLYMYSEAWSCRLGASALMMKDKMARTLLKSAKTGYSQVQSFVDCASRHGTKHWHYTHTSTSLFAQPQVILVCSHR